MMTKTMIVMMIKNIFQLTRKIMGYPTTIKPFKIQGLHKVMPIQIYYPIIYQFSLF